MSAYKRKHAYVKRKLKPNALNLVQHVSTLHRKNGRAYPAARSYPPYPLMVVMEYSLCRLGPRKTIASTGLPQLATKYGWASFFVRFPDQYWRSCNPNLANTCAEATFSTRYAAARKAMPCTDETLWFGYDASATYCAYLARKYEEKTAGLISYAGFWPRNFERIYDRNKFPVLILHSPADRLVRFQDVSHQVLQWDIRGHKVTVVDSLTGGHKFNYGEAIPHIAKWIEANGLTRPTDRPSRRTKLPRLGDHDDRGGDGV